ncbi:MAG: YihY/virulence factor BrkB family protein [Clostridia bacterium]|nr:YihY/virulence factor BrkB family protein [Clostridia bacterium]
MKIFKVLLNIFNKIKGDKIFVYSSHASFYILISAIPFITLFVSLIKLFAQISEYEIIKVFLSFFPEASLSAAKRILEEVFFKTSGRFLSFSLVSLFWTASRGISALRRGLRFIYELENPSFIKDFLTSIVLMFFVSVIIISLLILAVFSVIISSDFIMFLIGFFTLTIIFTLVYFLFADRKIPLLSNLPGGILASFSWIAFIRIFSFYIEHFTNYSYIYGSLTAIFLLVLWVYFSTIIFFLASELNILVFLNKQKGTVN